MSISPVVLGRGLTFRYASREPNVLEALDFEAARGSITVVTGPSGAGKSTLLSLLGLLQTPSDGRLMIAGSDMERAGDQERAHARAALIGFLFQDALLDPSRTVLDNVTEGQFYTGQSRRRSRPKALALLESMGLPHEIFSRRLPRAISGGQAQRVALCRCLIKDPIVVIADEPTGNLDAETSDLVLDVLRAATHDGAAVVIATHDSRVVERADHHLTLR